MIETTHDAVEGRARFRIEGLYRDAMLKEYLERALSEEDNISKVSANVLTGKILIIYNSNQSSAQVASILAKNLKSFGGKANKTIAASKNCYPNCAKQSSATLHKAKKRSRLAQQKENAVSKRKFRKMVEHAEMQAAKPWHVLDAGEVLDALQAQRLAGLTGEEADRRFQKYGPNVLPESVPRSGFSIFMEQLKSVPVALLAAAAGISLATGGIADAIAIVTVVGINAVIGYVTESQSERTIHSLKNLVHPVAQIVRDGQIRQFDAQKVVPGDLLVLRPGQYVAADVRLLEANRMSVDESALTGESMPVIKKTSALSDEVLPLSDRANMCYMGTLITGGQGLAVVVATGRFTEMGAIQSMVGETKPPETPMDKQLDEIGTKLVVVSSSLCGVVFVLGLLRGYGFLQMLRTAISLAVAAVPEGLPAVATTTLALGIREMRRHGVLIRHLNAIEALGAAQVICLDKTGTITENRMNVVEAYIGSRQIQIPQSDFLASLGAVSGEITDEVAVLVMVATLCNESEVTRADSGYVVNGSPTENALVYMAIGCGLDVLELKAAFQRERIVHRSEERNFMVTTHCDQNGKRLVAVKGSPNEVISLCSRQMKEGVIEEFSEEDRETIRVANDRMAGSALRVLGMAFALLDDEIVDEEVAVENLVWLGLVGMADPIRKGVKKLMGLFHEAGIKTVMITGDQSPTAFTVGKALVLNGGDKLQVLDSTSLSKMDTETMQALCQQTNVFSRVSPAHKLQIVQALQSSGKVVAMTGDGINDGPALKAADIGIAMGHTGTDVAREVADVVLEDDQLETMIIAIEQGRTIHINVRKALRFLLSTNLSEIIVTFTANVGGMGQPLTEMQLLWINLITDIFPGLALSLEQPEKDVMQRPPRDPEESIVTNADLKKTSVEASVISTGAMGCYGYGLTRYGIGPRASSMAFLSLTLGQLLHALSCRSETHSIFDKERLPPNKYLNLALGGSFALQALALFVPGLRSLLGIGALGVSDMLVVGGTSVLPLIVNESIKKERRGATT